MCISDWSSDVCSSDLTAKATEDIASQIKEIQNATNDAVTAIKDITATIAEIDTIGAAIAAAVEEQSAATQEISRNVQEADVGAQPAGSTITGEIGRAHVCTPVTNAQLVSRLMLEKNK